MTARFVPPQPNCGHVDGVTFTYVVVACIWMCPLCVASIGGLFQSCARCGCQPAPGTQLVPTTKGRLCTTCQRDQRAAIRGCQ